MKHSLLLLAMVLICTVVAHADEPVLLGLTAQKSILLSQPADAAPIEIKLASPVTADKLIGIAVVDALPENDGMELIVLRSDHHLEFYPLPTSNQTMLKRLGYCPLSNPAKRQEIAITVCNDQLIILDQADTNGTQYANIYPLKDLALKHAIVRSGYINLKNPKSPHLSLTHIDAVAQTPWASPDKQVLLTTSQDQYLELYSFQENKTQRIGQGFKRIGEIAPIAARWQNQTVTALYTDGNLVSFTQTLPSPQITQSIQTQLKDCADFLILTKAP